MDIPKFLRKFLTFHSETLEEANLRHATFNDLLLASPYLRTIFTKYREKRGSSAHSEGLEHFLRRNSTRVCVYGNFHAAFLPECSPCQIIQKSFQTFRRQPFIFSFRRQHKHSTLCQTTTLRLYLLNYSLIHHGIDWTFGRSHCARILHCCW